MLIGLNLGPDPFATGSLAWLSWLRAARDTGAQPSIARASRIGAVAVRLSMAAALACSLCLVPREGIGERPDPEGRSLSTALDLDLTRYFAKGCMAGKRKGRRHTSMTLGSGG